MKANEAPERIYLFDYNDAMVTPLEGDTVYVRKDAFIEKACEWIMNHFSSEGFGSQLYYKGLLYRPEDIVEDFKKYMKGE